MFTIANAKGVLCLDAKVLVAVHHFKNAKRNLGSPQRLEIFDRLDNNSMAAAKSLHGAFFVVQAPRTLCSIPILAGFTIG